MELLLKIVNSPDENITSKSFKFDESGGTIGRNGACSWVLNDSKRIISSIHAKIEYKAGGYYLIDISTNGVFYNHPNKRLSQNEMIELKESDKLYIGVYQISVSIIRSNDNNIDEFSVSRFLDLSRETSSEDDLLIGKEIKQEDISSSLPLPLEDDLFGVDDDPFGDKEESVESDNILVEDIRPPTVTSQVEKEKITEVSLESNRGEADTLLLSLFSAKLGVDIESMDKKEQIRVINELADSLLITLEEIDSLKSNINRINKRLEIDTDKYHPKAENIFSILGNPRNKKQFSQYLRESFSEVKNHHTSLYESIKNLDSFLAKQFSPKSIIDEFEKSNKLNSWSLKQKDIQIWKEYSKKYSYLNEDNGAGYSLVKRFIVKRYRDVMDMFKLAK